MNLEKAVSLDPKNGNALEDLAVLLVVQKQGAEAESLLTRAIAFEPNSTDLLLVRAEARILLKKYSAAQQDCDLVMKIEPGNQKVKRVAKEITAAKAQNH